MKLRTKQTLDLYAGGLLLGIIRPVCYALGLVLNRDHDPKPRGSVLIVKLLGAGSLVVALPALLGLRRSYPRFRLGIVTTPTVAAVVKTLGLFDELIIIDDGSPSRLLSSSIRALVSSLKYDTVIDFEVYSRLSTAFTCMTMTRNRVGFYLESAFYRRYVSTHLIYFNRSSASHYFYEEAIRLVGAKVADFDDCRRHLMETYLKNQPRSQLKHRVAIGHACSELGRERMLTPRQWREMCRLYLETGRHYEIVFLGAESDRGTAGTIIESLAGAFANLTFFNYCGELSFSDSIRVLASSGMFLGIDSLLLHYARLLGIDCISIWGPTDPSTRLRPIQGQRERIIYRKITCSPCIHVAESPPCGGDNLCIQNLFKKPVIGKNEGSASLPIYSSLEPENEPHLSDVERKSESSIHRYGLRVTQAEFMDEV